MAQENFPGLALFHATGAKVLTDRKSSAHDAAQRLCAAAPADLPGRAVSVQRAGQGRELGLGDEAGRRGPAAPAMLVAAIVVELVAPVCIVLGWHDRLAAFVLAGFCVVTAVLYHQFWRYPEFWRFQEGEGLEHFWEFLKNFGLVGGLGLVMLAPRTLPLSDVAQQPLASTYVAGPDAGQSDADPASSTRCPSGSRSRGGAGTPGTRSVTQSAAMSLCAIRSAVRRPVAEQFQPRPHPRRRAQAGDTARAAPGSPSNRACAGP